MKCTFAKKAQKVNEEQRQKSWDMEKFCSTIFVLITFCVEAAVLEIFATKRCAKAIFFICAIQFS